jgi:type II secretory pathway component HofQ
MNEGVRLRDGETVVLRGTVDETVETIKDKVGVIAELPPMGPSFRNETKPGPKKELLVFVTPTLVDRAGNLIHSPDEMRLLGGVAPPQPAR